MTRRLAAGPGRWQIVSSWVVVPLVTVMALASITPAAPVAAPQKKAKKEVQEPKPGAKYDTADEALRAGVAYLQLKEVAKSQEPLEQALKLAPDDKYRIKVYELLLEPYRQLSEPDKGVEALEFIIDKTDSSAKRSLTRNSLMKIGRAHV